MHYLGNREPSLDELLHDPIVHLVMARDRLSADTLHRYFETARRALHRRRMIEANDGVSCPENEGRH
jgi:hypothetical protein